MLSNIETSYRPTFQPEKKSLRGKTAVIVGDSSGIGRATAALLAASGARVFFVAQSSTELNSAFATLAQEGEQWDGTVVDLHEDAGTRNLFEQASRRLGKIDLFIHPYSLETPESNDQLVQTAIQHMTRGGQIVQVRQPAEATTLDLRVPDTKGRLVSLRREARSRNIHLTRIEPGANNYRSLNDGCLVLNSGQVAQFVLDSLLQPFEVDVLFLPGMVESVM